MRPEELKAWITTAAGLAHAGIQVAHLIEGWIGQAQPDLSEEQKRAAYLDIIADDNVRAAFAKQAYGG